MSAIRMRMRIDSLSGGAPSDIADAKRCLKEC